MAAISSRKRAFKSEVRDAAQRIWGAVQDLKGLRAEADAQNYGATLDDLDGEVAAADILAIPYATADALNTLMGQGHATNLTNVL